MRILVVEDEPTLAEQLAQAIAAAGHTVERAADGRMAKLKVDAVDGKLLSIKRKERD